jgi:hypothetical protein
MLLKIKRVFFPSVFFVLYALFVVQIAVTIIGLASANGLSRGYFESVTLALEWLALISARYLYKKSANPQNGGYRNAHGNNNRNGHYHR